MSIFSKKDALTMGKNVGIIQTYSKEEILDEIDKLVESGREIKDVKFSMTTGSEYLALVIFDRWKEKTKQHTDKDMGLNR